MTKWLLVNQCNPFAVLLGIRWLSLDDPPSTTIHVQPTLDWWFLPFHLSLSSLACPCATCLSRMKKDGKTELWMQDMDCAKMLLRYQMSIVYTDTLIVFCLPVCCVLQHALFGCIDSYAGCLYAFPTLSAALAMLRADDLRRASCNVTSRERSQV